MGCAQCDVDGFNGGASDLPYLGAPECICEYWLHSRRRWWNIQIDTYSFPEFTSSQGITYVSIEYALFYLNENGNYVFAFNGDTYDIHINKWNVSLVTSMKGNAESFFDNNVLLIIL